jgi:hypothetical protein
MASLLRLVLGQQVFHSLDLVLRRLFLVRSMRNPCLACHRPRHHGNNAHEGRLNLPATNPHRRLNPDYTTAVHNSMRLSYSRHNLIPRSL